MIVTEIFLKMSNVDMYNGEFYEATYYGAGKYYEVKLEPKPGFLTKEEVEEIAGKYNAEIIKFTYKFY